MKEYQNESSLDNLIEKTLSSLKIISDSKMIFGEKIIASDGTIIIPVSKATIGFVVGGGEYSDLSARRVGTHYPMAGGSGGGIVLNPIGFLINSKDKISYISTAESNYQKILENIGNIGDFIKNIIKKEDKK
jgi:sporulation protein YtfJ